MNSRFIPSICPFCGGAGHDPVAIVDRLGQGEKDLGFQDYYRELWRCRTCGHMRNLHAHDLSSLYESAYNGATYGDGLKRQYDKVMSLPYASSDNRQRVARINAALPGPPGRRLLDVGSGSAVFPAAMREAGWSVTAMDPDPKAAEHATRHAGVTALVGDIMQSELPDHYDLITFNKVLEHVPDPISALERARRALPPQGCVYIELPDAEAALADGAGRQEFFLEHWHIFSMASLSLLARRAGLRADQAARLRDPSGKYTLYAFLRPDDAR